MKEKGKGKSLSPYIIRAEENQQPYLNTRSTLNGIPTYEITKELESTNHPPKKMIQAEIQKAQKQYLEIQNNMLSDDDALSQHVFPGLYSPAQGYASNSTTTGSYPMLHAYH